MALVLANRVQETATPNTTVSFTLTGAVSGFQTFAVIGNTNTTYYSATDTAGNWEVGEGTYSTTGPTLARTTIYASSNSGSAVTFPGSVNVFVTYPSGKSVNLDGSGNVSALGTVTSGVWQGSTVGVAYGGTGVTSSSGPNSVVLRDANSNITVNRINQGLQTVTATGGVTILTVASQFNQALVGTGNHTFRLPDATTLSATTAFQFNNNATGTLTIQNNAGTTVGTIAPGGAAGIALLSNATVGGTWDVHAYIPENVTWGSNALALGSTVISGGTWQGGTIQSGYGGTGLTTFIGPNNALYSTGASTLTAGILPVAAGGNGTAFPGLIGGVNISISGCWPSQTINSTVPPVACATPTVAGIVYGRTTTCCFGGNTLLGHSSSSACIHGVAVGIYSNTANFGTAVGKSANACYAGVAVGINAFASSYSVALGPCVSAAGPNQTHIGPIRNVCSTSGLTSLFYNAGTKEIVQAAGGGGVCCATPTAAGIVYGRTTCAALTGKTALGYWAGDTSQGCYTVALGAEAGQSNQGNRAVAIGRQTAQTSQGAGAVAIGYRAGEVNQGGSAIAIGDCASWNTQGINAIAIGFSAGGANQPGCSIAIGANAVTTNPFFPCFYITTPIAIGTSSFATDNGVALGAQARAGTQAVAIGTSSGIYCGGPFSSSSVTIGSGTQAYNSVGAVALGSFNSANCAPYGVSIGYGAFVNAPNSIVINATGSPLCASTSNQTHIAPIRSVCSTTGLTSLFYNACTKEVVQAAGGGGGGSPATPCVAGTVYGFTATVCGGSKTALGYLANTNYGNNNVAIGVASIASGCCMPACNAIAIGSTAVASSSGSIAIGSAASTFAFFPCVTTNSIVIGSGANTGKCYTLAIGSSASVYGSYSIAIGSSASIPFGASNAIAIGAFSGVAGGAYCGVAVGGYVSGAEGTALGRFTSAAYGAVAIGRGATSSHTFSIAIGQCTNTTGCNQFHVKPIRNASGPFTLRYNPTTGEITYN